MISFPSPQSDWDHGPRRAPRSAFKDFRTNGDLKTTIVHPADRTIEYNFPGVTVGGAVYEEGPTGATVVDIEGGARTYVDRLGGAVGVSGGYEFNRAISIAGGSVHGLGAAAGVTDALLADGVANSHFAEVALVSGGVIYDFAIRDNAIVPDAALGAAAWRNRRGGTIDVGRVGAGIGATVGKTRAERIEVSGQGAAFMQHGAYKFLALTVVNAIGAVFDRDGTVLRGNIGPDGTRRHPVIDGAEALHEGASGMLAGNTTLSVIVTNARLDDIHLKQFAKQVHSSMHRGIQPFATMMDGDCLFALTTDEVELPTEVDGIPVDLSPSLGALASEAMWDAVIESVR